MDASTRTSRSQAVDAETLQRHAELIVGFGANVRPDQIVEVRATLEQRELVHAVAAAAYERGAKFVEVLYFDPYVRRARIQHAQLETLDFVPSWQRERILALGDQRCARIALSQTVPPELLADLDPAAVGRELSGFPPEYMQVINDRTTNWTGAPGPTPGWAELVYPELEPEEALATLWQAVTRVCRLDEDDPTTVWRARFDQLERAESALNERRFDALHFEGPGTDLTVGLLPTSTWDSGISDTVDGIEHAANIPTEETFTAPDPARVDGIVSATKPLMEGGVLIADLVVRFEAGRAVQVDASSGADALRTIFERNENADRLGEVALVDREGRVGALNTVFYNTLLDENAASHLAFGSAYLDTVGEEDRARVNRSRVHVDFMIGGDEVDVTGVTRDGSRVPVLRGGAWQI